MLFSEPESSNFDWNFRLAGHSVRVHPYFWLATVFMGFGDPAGLLAWIPAVFISILIHEMGHVWAMRRYGGDGDIVLYSFGGLAIPRRHFSSTTKQDIVISAAGPGAGFLLAALILVLVNLLGGQVVYFPAWDLIPNWYAFLGPGEPGLFGDFVNDVIWCSVFWGFMNLLPVLPLDGGHISEAFFVARKGERGRVVAHQISFVVSTVVALSMAVTRNLFLGFLYGSLAYSSFQFLQQSESRWQRND